MARAAINRGNQGYERIVSAIAGAVCLGLVVFLVVRNQPFADGNLAFLMRVVIALVAAVFGATLPGFLNLTWSVGGLAMRAGGALALFALTFVYTPTPYQHPDCTVNVAAPECQARSSVLSDLSAATRALQEMQDAKQGGLFMYLQSYLDNPSPSTWSVVPIQAKRVEDLLDGALKAVLKYESMVKVQLKTTYPTMTSLLYAREPLLLELTQPAPLEPARAHDLLVRLQQLAQPVQDEIDRLKAEIAMVTTA